MGRLKIQIPKEDLIKFYWGQGLSPIKIGRLYNCDAVTVRTRLRELNITLRSKSEAQMRYQKIDFSGDGVEMAYLIGFRLGDLNVYQRNANSSLIVVRCNTTQKVQIDLITSLFSKYGKVTISPGKYSTNINCFLNNTFSFLKPKNCGIPEWLNQSNQYSASFTAGYTDAEGNFLLNQKRARFKIDSYDKDILFWISDWLNKLGLNVKIRCIAKLGDVQKGTMLYRNDLWRLNINAADSLLKFIELIKPFVKHEMRLKQIIICENNIRERTAKKESFYATR